MAGRVAVPCPYSYRHRESNIFYFLCDPKQWITLNTIVGCFGKQQQKKKVLEVVAVYA